MLTQTMPALSRALDGQLPPQVVRAVMQALGNCGQEVVQRGGMSVLPNRLTGLSPRGPQGWNPYGTPNININDGGAWVPPNALNDPFVDMPNGGGFHAGNWYSTNYGSPNYAFNSATSNQINQFFGGPTSYFGGNTVFENIITNNISITNQGGNVFGGTPQRGPAGTAGNDGSDGTDGIDGPSGPPGADGLDGAIPGIPVRRTRMLKDVTVRDDWYTVVTDVTFDAETCTLQRKLGVFPVVRAIDKVPGSIQYFGP